MENNTFYICPICKRSIPFQYMEKHHLIPKTKKGKETVLMCNCCADQLHQLFSNKELSKNLNTIEKLVAHPKMQRWAEWIGKKPSEFRIAMARKK